MYLKFWKIFSRVQIIKRKQISSSDNISLTIFFKKKHNINITNSLVPSRRFDYIRENYGQAADNME